MVSVVGDDRSGDPLHFEYIWSFIHIFPISLTFGRQCGYHTNTGRLQVPTRATRQIRPRVNDMENGVFNIPS